MKKVNAYKAMQAPFCLCGNQPYVLHAKKYLYTKNGCRLVHGGAQSKQWIVNCLHCDSRSVAGTKRAAIAKFEQAQKIV